MTPSRDLLHQLGGVTGLGWTASIIGYVSTFFGIGTVYFTRIAADPHSFLYTGVILFLATLGLDRLAERRNDD